jgi:hypothetical protein
MQAGHSHSPSLILKSTMSASDDSAAADEHCSMCKTVVASKHCSGCGMAYCGRACQVAHWKTGSATANDAKPHSATCARLPSMGGVRLVWATGSVFNSPLCTEGEFRPTDDEAPCGAFVHTVPAGTSFVAYLAAMCKRSGGRLEVDCCLAVQVLQQVRLEMYRPSAQEHARTCMFCVGQFAHSHITYGAGADVLPAVYMSIRDKEVYTKRLCFEFANCGQWLVRDAVADAVAVAVATTATSTTATNTTTTNINANASAATYVGMTRAGPMRRTLADWQSFTSAALVVEIADVRARNGGNDNYSTDANGHETPASVKLALLDCYEKQGTFAAKEWILHH